MTIAQPVRLIFNQPMSLPIIQSFLIQPCGGLTQVTIIQLIIILVLFNLRIKYLRKNNSSSIFPQMDSSYEPIIDSMFKQLLQETNFFDKPLQNQNIVKIIFMKYVKLNTQIIKEKSLNENHSNNILKPAESVDHENTTHRQNEFTSGFDQNPQFNSIYFNHQNDKESLTGIVQNKSNRSNNNNQNFDEKIEKQYNVTDKNLIEKKNNNIKNNQIFDNQNEQSYNIPVNSSTEKINKDRQEQQKENLKENLMKNKIKFNNTIDLKKIPEQTDHNKYDEENFDDFQSEKDIGKSQSKIEKNRFILQKMEQEWLSKKNNTLVNQNQLRTELFRLISHFFKEYSIYDIENVIMLSDKFQWIKVHNYYDILSKKLQEQIPQIQGLLMFKSNLVSMVEYESIVDQFNKYFKNTQKKDNNCVTDIIGQNIQNISELQREVNFNIKNSQISRLNCLRFYRKHIPKKFCIEIILIKCKTCKFSVKTVNQKDKIGDVLYQYYINELNDKKLLENNGQKNQETLNNILLSEISNQILKYVNFLKTIE